MVFLLNLMINPDTLPMFTHKYYKSILFRLVNFISQRLNPFIIDVSLEINVGLIVIFTYFECDDVSGVEMVGGAEEGQWERAAGLTAREFIVASDGKVDRRSFGVLDCYVK